MDINDKQDLCSPCEYQSKTTLATQWCIDCKEPLCVSCYGNHNAHRYSRNHHVISIESNKMLQSLKIPLNEYCEAHDQEKDLYCSLHNEIICLTCTQTTHGKCVPAVRLSEVNLNANLEKLNLQIDNNVHFLNDHLNEFDEIRKKIDILKDNASDTQTFIGVRALEKVFHYKEVRLTSFLELIQNLNIEFEVNKDIFVACADIRSFGDIRVQTLDTGYFNFLKNRGQYPINRQLKLSKALEIKIPQESFFRSIILSCVILPNKQVICVDSHARNKRLIVLNEDGSHDRNINLTSKPFDIAVIDDNKIALSFPWSARKRIGIINMSNSKLDPDILLKNKCYGISYDKERLFVVVKTEGILIMDLCGQVSACLPIEGQGIFYVHVKNDRIYCSDECNDTVQCYDMEGCSIWTFKDSNLESPRSISADDNFILIAGCKTNNVVSVYLNGSLARVICDSDDGINNPTSIYFDSQNLLVCNSSNAQAFLYKVN
ncbi:unnamed protein product [Mytilus edulis]|uniref:B box-type domain-containing protein n=1 Tax=Mytilus edulis TaxID=6550 RepID=A0A8S3RPK0_MYTED|nr:unnamed protein product [Mytilus edulis]